MCDLCLLIQSGALKRRRWHAVRRRVVPATEARHHPVAGDIDATESCMADPVLTVPASVGPFPGARAAASSLPSIPHGERPFGAPNPATPVAAAQSARPVPAPRAQARVQTDGDTGVEAGPATTRLSFPVCRADGQPFADLAEIEALLSAEQQGQLSWVAIAAGMAASISPPPPCPSIGLSSRCVA